MCTAKQQGGNSHGIIFTALPPLWVRTPGFAGVSEMPTTSRNRRTFSPAGGSVCARQEGNNMNTPICHYCSSSENVGYYPDTNRYICMRCKPTVIEFPNTVCLCKHCKRWFTDIMHASNNVCDTCYNKIVKLNRLLRGHLVNHGLDDFCRSFPGAVEDGILQQFGVRKCGGFIAIPWPRKETTTTWNIMKFRLTISPPDKQ